MELFVVAFNGAIRAPIVAGVLKGDGDHPGDLRAEPYADYVFPR